jgi:hypothetical protein
MRSRTRLESSSISSAHQNGTVKDKISDNVLHIENEVKRISRLLEQLKGKRDAGKTYGVQGMRVSAIIRRDSGFIDPEHSEQRDQVQL